MENTTNISIPMIPLEPAINTAEIKAETLINLMCYFYTLFKDNNVPDRFETFMSDCTKQAKQRVEINELLIFENNNQEMLPVYDTQPTIDLDNNTDNKLNNDSLHNNKDKEETLNKNNESENIVNNNVINDSEIGLKPI